MRIGIWFAVALAVAMPAQAEMERAEAGLYRIDLAGSLRMRTQRMVRDTCYIASGISTDDVIDSVNQDIADLDASQQVLLDGDAAIGLGAERSPIIKHYIERIIAPDWERFRLYPLDIATRGSAQRHELGEMSALGDQLIAHVNDLVGDLEEKYARAAVLSAEQTRTLNVMGRQRMLSQKLAAQHCMVAHADRPLDARIALAATFSRLGTAFEDLTAGNPDAQILPADGATQLSLRCAGETFEAMTPLIERVLLGHNPSLVEMAQIDRLSATLLAQSQQVVAVTRAGFAGDVVEQFEACGSS